MRKKKQPQSDVKFWSTAETAYFLGCSEAWVRDRCNHGHIRGAFKLGDGRAWIIPIWAAREYAAEHNGQ
jgi:hypothetical protein